MPMIPSPRSRFIVASSRSTPEAWVVAHSHGVNRRLIGAIVVVTLALFVLVIADLARGGRPDPPALRAAATVLAGPWHFHLGDDPRWADADTDDSRWETIDLT